MWLKAAACKAVAVYSAQGNLRLHPPHATPPASPAVDSYVILAEGKLMTATPEEMEKLSEEMAEYERQVASLSQKIEEAAANAAARAAA